MDVSASRVAALTSIRQAGEDRLHQPDPDTLIRAVQQVNGAGVVGDGKELTITFEQDAKRPVLRIVDRETKEVLRQIPAEYVLRLARNYHKTIAK
ncbi:MAG TPA: flagellar protein FlaG [Bryobacteraceae bacterium]|jgi:flagellar protein FlaG|nr:flagellar protein FlaG [Bryobacteraceae bacterium]